MTTYRCMIEKFSDIVAESKEEAVEKFIQQIVDEAKEGESSVIVWENS